MAEDIRALELLRNEYAALQGLPDPPRDIDKIEAFETAWSQQLGLTQSLFDEISTYTEAIYGEAEELRNLLNNSTTEVQQCLLELIDSLKSSEPRTGSGSGYTSIAQKSSGYISNLQNGSGFTSTSQKGSGRTSTSQKGSGHTSTSQKALWLIEKLQKMEQKKNRLEESIMLTQLMVHKLENLGIITEEDVDEWRGCIEQWIDVRDESYDKEKRRKEAKEKARKKRQEEERKIKEKQKQEQEEKDERRKQKEEEKRRLEEEKRRLEEEEKRRLEEEGKLRREVEEKRRLEEEEKRRLEEEEKRRLEVEEKRKLEEEEKRRREEEEKRRREEEERKRRLDPKTWDVSKYERSKWGVDDERAGLCCVVSAIKGAVKKEDFECVSFDEVRDGEPTVAAGEKIASSVVSITSKVGEINLEAPMRVFVPHKMVDSHDEFVIKSSVNGGVWKEMPSIFHSGLLKDRQNVSLIGTEVNQFEEAKFVVVARMRSEDITVDKPGLIYQSSVDKNIKFVFPRDTFKYPTRVKIQILQQQSEHLRLATRENEICEKILSISPFVTVTTEEETEMDFDVDITRPAISDSGIGKGRYHTLFKGRDHQWHFADSGMKNRSRNVSITLPHGRQHYIVTELETRNEIPKDEVLQAAKEIYKHAHKYIVRLIAKQKIENQSFLMLQCLGRDKISARLSELDKIGYSVGPDTSKEFLMSDGKNLLVSSKGNIGMTTESNKNNVSLTYHTYMDSAKQEVSLFVVDENKQKYSDIYLGSLLFETDDDERPYTKGDLPISMPKIRQNKPLQIARLPVRFEPYPLCRYLGFRLNVYDDDNWVAILRHLDDKRKMDAIHRRAKTEVKDDNRRLCQKVFENWMKTKNKNDDKVQPVIGALLSSGYKELAKECKCLVKIHKVLFSDNVMSVLSDNTNDDFDTLARKLDLSSEEIKQCKSQQSNQHIHCAWSAWQQSDSVIFRGPEASEYCLQTIESVIGKDHLLDDLKLKLEQAGIQA